MNPNPSDSISESTRLRLADFLRRYLTAASWVYFTFLFGWLAVYLLFGDRSGYLGHVNNMAFILFLPLPLVMAVAVYVHRRDVWVCVGLGAAAFIWLWGGLFLPRVFPPKTEAPTLTVMTYNVLGLHEYSGAILEVIRHEDADVVIFQEVNNALANVIQTTLSDIYPYQVMDPYDDVRGMGAISKYPIYPTGEKFELLWVGEPQILTLEWEGQEITLVNFHMWPTWLSSPESVTANYRLREEQARELAEYAEIAIQRGPVIAAGDANTSSLNEAYKIVTLHLRDAWKDAGFGLGHTFPGSDIPESSRWRIAGYPVPQWLVRIDFIFPSHHWSALTAHLALFDQVSDHRAVVATLTLKEN